MTGHELTRHERPRRRLHGAAMPRHTDGLWIALATAVREDETEDLHASRHRLAALRLHRAYASLSDLERPAC
jgi:hypothetical protein